MSIHLSAVQMDCRLGDFRANAAAVCRLLAVVRESDPETELAVFPEMALYGYSSLECLKRVSKEEIETALAEIACACHRLGINAVFGAPSVGGGVNGCSAVENSLYLAERSGKVGKVFSKIHLIEAEKGIFKEGNSLTICKFPFGRVGFLICWDAAFPEVGLSYAREGADLLLVSAAWEKPLERQWKLAVCGSAFSSGMPVIACNRVGLDGKNEFFGHSIISDSSGEILSAGSGEEGIVSAVLDMEKEKEKRRKFCPDCGRLKHGPYCPVCMRFIAGEPTAFFKEQREFKRKGTSYER